MNKYIVEAPEIKIGQTLSSGGIREGGRIVTQYKNPIPYCEPSSTNALTTPSTNNYMTGSNPIVKNIVGTLVGVAVVELCSPLISYSMNKISEKIINKIESKDNHTETYVESACNDVYESSITISDECKQQKLSNNNRTPIIPYSEYLANQTSI